MFETVNAPGLPRRTTLVTLGASIIAHAAILGLLVIAPILYFTDQLPTPPDMLAFVVASAPPPPPPPPPPPAATPERARPAQRVSVDEQPATAVTAPVEAPSNIQPEVLLEEPGQTFAGGVEGGIVGGIAGGIAGGIPFMPAPPPPPPPPAPARTVRVGGDIDAPALLHRVNPEYPQIAISAKVEGIVILEAMVGPDGAVRTVKVLRSSPLLDTAAIEAVKQWRYSPLLLNGVAHPFVLTVTVSFNL